MPYQKDPRGRSKSLREERRPRREPIEPKRKEEAQSRTEPINPHRHESEERKFGRSTVDSHTESKQDRSATSSETLQGEQESSWNETKGRIKSFLNGLFSSFSSTIFFHTNKSVDEVREVLKSNITELTTGPLSKMEGRMTDDNKDFIGNVFLRDFEAQFKHGSSNSFSPQISGVLHEVENGTRVEIEFSFEPFRNSLKILWALVFFIFILPRFHFSSFYSIFLIIAVPIIYGTFQTKYVKKVEEAKVKFRVMLG
ncbi:MAG: hypothetical protein HWE14_05185 [Flavobacteriia bacterium]|nr:hypothetical protein [Flavobacteriia bacterium]